MFKKFAQSRNAIAALVVVVAGLLLAVVLPLLAPFPGWAAGLVGLVVGAIAGGLAVLGHGTSQDDLLSIHTGIGAARRGERSSRPLEVSAGAGDLLTALDNVADDVQSRVRRLKEAETKRDELQVQVGERDRRLGQAIRGLDVLVDELSAALHEQTSAVEHLAGSVEATNGVDGASRSTDLVLETERSAESMQRAAEEARRLEASAAKATATLAVVETRAHSMREAVDDVERALRQAEVIAINVEILAGNAGETARGFEAAAKEIKELTDRARDSIRLLAHLVETTANEARTAGDALSLGTAGVERVARTSADAERMLRDLAALHRAQPARAGAWREAASLVERIRDLSHAHERRAAALAETLERLRAPSQETGGPA